MIKKIVFVITTLFMSCGAALASDITGNWRQIDDKTGASRAIIEIRKESDGKYVGKIVKITPRPGYTPKETCVGCPAPYTNKPMLGLDVFKDLQYEKNNEYNNGKILDPLSGKIYSMKAKLTSNGNRLQMRGYIGVSALGRTQTWIRTTQN